VRIARGAGGKTAPRDLWKSSVVVLGCYWLAAGVGFVDFAETDKFGPCFYKIRK